MSSTQSDDKNKDKPSTLTIIGYVVLGIVALIIVSIILYFLVGKLYKSHLQTEYDKLYGSSSTIDIDYPRFKPPSQSPPRSVF